MVKKLYRAEEDYSEENSGVINIAIREFDVVKESKCFYFIGNDRSNRLKRVHKVTFKYAQESKKQALEALINRLNTQVKWWKARIEWAAKMLPVVKEMLKNM